MRKTDAMHAADAVMARTEPGSGKDLKWDGLGEAPVSVTKIPNLSTERLVRASEFYHGSIHTPEGIHEWDQPRSQMVATGMRLQAVHHELHLRGVGDGSCPHCT